VSDIEDDEQDRGSKMPPVISDPLWKRVGAGRPSLFNTPEDLWQAALEYFQWAENNPLWEAKAFSFQGGSWLEYLPKLRAFTFDGFQLHAGICDQTWRNYKNKEEFFGVASKIEKCIRDQKFSGAAADLLNANIIARDLGLKDNVVNEVTANIKAETISATATPQDAADAYQRLMRGG